MADVACFCGCFYSFDGSAGACPQCGEYATLRTEAHAVYALGHSPAERDRLRRQASELREASSVLLDRALRQHLDDPKTLMLPSLLFLTWGRKQPA